MAIPASSDEWAVIAEGFEYKWNFPNCVGAIDGKHIRIQAPPSAESTYYNYKGYNSIVLMAVADASYTFLYVDSGNYGRISDGGIFSNCSLGKALVSETLFSFPNPTPLLNSDRVLPFVFVGDEAFPLRKNILRPYPGKFLSNERKIFNYRLSRARRCVENAFGILASRWRVLRTEIALNPEHANKVVLACCCLHNYLMKNELGKAAKKYCPVNFADSLLSNATIKEGMWRTEEFTWQPLGRLGANNSSRAASAVRDNFCEYFSAEGAVPWQERKAFLV
ncbi:protein ALP1-like isoform X2 [Stegodyphus dumicola]|nr:protein ALP1-like isoform X2 [Stegodyphus dumicola]